jgi:hypothetical protein
MVHLIGYILPDLRYVVKYAEVCGGRAEFRKVNVEMTVLFDSDSQHVTCTLSS